MTRELFLTLTAAITVSIGAFALITPGKLLASKGVPPNPGANIWVREVGVLLIATGTVAFLVRGQADSTTLQALLIGNAIVQLGLLPIEIIAFGRGIIRNVSGIIPNSILHTLLAGGFAYYALTMHI